MVLVDTSVWIDAEHGVAPALARLRALTVSREVRVSAVTVHELACGRTTAPTVLARYDTVFPALVPVLPVTLDTARIAARIARGLGPAIATPDALVAATALEHRLPLLTSDAGFRLVPGLEVEWIPRPPVLHEPVAAWAARPPPPAAVGARLRELRRAAGLRACQVAEAAGMARSNYARLEAGRHRPSLATLARAAAALRVPVAELLRAAG